MNYKYTGYNRLLVADLYYWDMNDVGGFFIGARNETKTEQMG